MKNPPLNLWKLLGLTGVVLGMLVHSSAHAQDAPYRLLSFDRKFMVVNTSFSLPPGNYLGSGVVTIKPEKGQRCTFEISGSTVIEAAKFVVHEGAQLRMRGAMLRRCQIYAEPGSEVVIEASGLDGCELGGDSSKTKSPTSFRITNSIIQGGAWIAPGNRINLEMLDCLVREQLSRTHSLRMTISAESTPVILARKPAIRYTKFVNCAIHPTLLTSVSQVTIEGCKALFGAGTSLFGVGANAAPEVTLPVRWDNNEPAALPLLGGGIALQHLASPISGGCSLVTKIDEGRLSLEGLVTATPRPLKDALPVPVPAGKIAGPTGPASAPDDGTRRVLKLKQSHVNALLVMDLGNGLMAGQMTKMNITAVLGSSAMRFSQYVGEDMAVALREVEKFLQLRFGLLPAGVDLEIAFEEKYSDKDGPSGAVACALLVESVITGKVWDPAFAVTGDMNADGAVQPIGGVAAKVRGATKGGCKIVAIPAKNESGVADIMVVDGPAPLAAIHIFGLTTFEQALHLADPGRPEVLQQAITEFEIIRTALQRDPRQMTAILRTSQAIARLQAVLEKAPNSLSAKYLLQFAQGSPPSTLSLSGSLEAADASALALVGSVQNDFRGTVGALKHDELGGSLNRLRNLRPRLDPRLWSYVDSLVDYGEIVRSEVLNPARTSAKFSEMAARARGAASGVVSAKKIIMSDPQVREDLGL